MRAKIESDPNFRRRVDGVLLLDKPAGLSSNAALQRARRLAAAEKAGHTGTLDPLASGLLPLCFGEATKFARFLLEARKRYIATVRFGVATTTQDAEGAIVTTAPVTFDAGQLVDALPAFTGTLRQVPPAHSALKHRGRSYYEYARAGIAIPRPAREIRIDRLALVAWSPPDATLDVVCGKGTYIRALAADLGEALGCGAHLAALRRTETGGFTLAEAITLEAFEALPESRRETQLLPVDRLLGELPRLDVAADAAAAVRAGRAIPAEGDGEMCRVYGPDGRLLGLLRREGGALRPERLVRSDSAGCGN